VKRDGHFAGYLYGTECACPMLVFELSLLWKRGGGCRIVGYFSRAFSIFCNFITMDMFSMGFSLVFELL
jgi:hypothetical protein